VRPILRYVLAVVAGLVVGGLLNGGLIAVSGRVIPPPAGADVTTVEGLKASIHLFAPRHFVFPFAAHALGTLAAAFLAGLIAPARKMTLGLVVGAVFLAAGVANVMMLPAPLWFEVLDLAGAYLPMGWLGARLAPREA